MKIEFLPPRVDALIKQINDEINKPKRKVAFLAIDPKTNKSIYYGSADYPLKRIGEHNK